jgi:hypothetical protein
VAFVAGPFDENTRRLAKEGIKRLRACCIIRFAVPYQSRGPTLALPRSATHKNRPTIAQQRREIASLEKKL